MQNALRKPEMWISVDLRRIATHIPLQQPHPSYVQNRYSAKIYYTYCWILRVAVAVNYINRLRKT